MVPVSDCPLSREKMAAAAAIDTEGRSSRATLLGGEGREREGRACRNRATSAAEARGERLERTKRRLGCWTNGRGRKRIAKGGGGGGVA